jgi:hypothetical protein
MQIDTELLSAAKEQGFQLNFQLEGEHHFWDRDVDQVFWFVTPDGEKSKEYKYFEVFQDHLRMSVKKKREGKGLLMVSQ